MEAAFRPALVKGEVDITERKKIPTLMERRRRCGDVLHLQLRRVVFWRVAWRMARSLHSLVAPFPSSRCHPFLSLVLLYPIFLGVGALLVFSGAGLLQERRDGFGFLYVIAGQSLLEE